MSSVRTPATTIAIWFLRDPYDCALHAQNVPDLSQSNSSRFGAPQFTYHRSRISLRFVRSVRSVLSARYVRRPKSHMIICSRKQRDKHFSRSTYPEFSTTTCTYARKSAWSNMLWYSNEQRLRALNMIMTMRAQCDNVMLRYQQVSDLREYHYPDFR